MPRFDVHCKRLTFHDEFLTIVDLPNVKLVRTDGHGNERVSEKGLVTGVVEYEVDCFIFSTGIEYLQFFHRTGRFTVEGVRGRFPADKWSEHFHSLHGVFHTRLPEHGLC